MKRLHLRVLLCCLAASPWAACPAAAQDRPLSFIQRRGGELLEDGQPFRFVSWNIPNLHCVEDSLPFFAESGWRWPNEFEVRDALRTVAQMGGRVARTYVISVRRSDGDIGPHAYVLGPDRFNERAFKTLDLVIKTAEQEGVRLIIPLVDNWHWWGGIEQYAEFRGMPAEAFWTDSRVMEDFKATVRYVLTRKNHLTGRRYRDEPAILAWETGNELDAPAEWTRAIAAFVKRVDPNHLVTDGRSLHGVSAASLDDPNIDIVTTHHYPNVGNNTAESVAEAIREVSGRKPYVVGEFGFVGVDEAQRMLDVAIDQGAAGALYWSLRYHRREGGFYWHDEPSGQGVFKAFHWPGFPSGDGYREAEVMRMLRGAAFRIRGLPLPPRPVPEAPRLLPCPRPLLLAWQGATGASGYDIHRAPSSEGPWETIAKDVNDAALPYQPLFADESARPGVDYYYRVVAHSDTGESPPSNVVGPVKSPGWLVVDDFRDASRLHAHSGQVTAVSGDARRAREDFHRLALSKGASVTYRLDGPLQELRLWTFCESSTDPVRVEVSTGGEEYVEAAAHRKSSKTGDSDYGYLRPVMYEAGPTSDTGVRFVRLTAKAGVELSRVEIRHGEPSLDQP